MNRDPSMMTCTSYQAELQELSGTAQHALSRLDTFRKTLGFGTLPWPERRRLGGIRNQLAKVVAALTAGLLLAACASTSDPRVLVRTETVEVPVPTPVPVSPSLTTPPPEPQLPPERLTNRDLEQHIEALRAYTCALRSQLADIAIAHGAGSEPVDCGGAP